MIQDELRHLIAQGEGPRLEFAGPSARTGKRFLAALEDGVRTIAAFANAEGGVILSRSASRG
jgi:hypothetical protein